MNYCIYLRKSRADAEAELHGEGETLARHEKALTEFARYANLNVTAVYREIVSGETIAARPEMQKLLSEVSAGLWDGVIVMDIDRLARGNSIDQGIISQTFLFANTKIITPTKTYDPSNEFDEEYFEFGLFMSRREYKTINRRLQRGRIASVKEGKYVSNKAPYGYERIKIDNDKGFTLRIIPEQAEVIRNIFQWYTDGILQPDGTKKRIGVNLIARELNHRNLKAATGGVWTSQTIRDILINPVFYGKVRWNWRPAKKRIINGTVMTERPRSDDFMLSDGLHEPIISEQTFNMAQYFMNQNKKRPVRGDKKITNPLAGLVVCQKCGRKMQKRSNPKTADLLMCSEPTCDNHAAFLYLIEERVIQALKEWAEKYKLDNPPTELPHTDYTEELKNLNTAIKNTENQLSKAFEAFETGIYDAETFRLRNTTLKNRIAEIQNKKETILQNAEKINTVEQAMKKLIPAVDHLIAVYSGLSDAESKNSMLTSVIDHIDYIKTTRGHGHEREFEIVLHPMLPKK